MNTDTNGVLPYKPIQWRRALRALVGLARDTKRTDHVFEIISALSGNSFERTYQGFIATEHGRRLLATKPSLSEVLQDHDALERMPRGSLGRAYLAFMVDNGLTSDGLISAQDAAVDPNADIELDPERRYVADRLRDMHDLWHVLTGYDMDDTGEIANLWFSVGQFGNPGMAFIAFFGTLGGEWSWDLGWQRYCYRAWRRGRVAERLVSRPIEHMLELPIDEARRRLGIDDPTAAHPSGLRGGYRRDGALGALAA